MYVMMVVEHITQVINHQRVEEDNSLMICASSSINTGLARRSEDMRLARRSEDMHIFAQ
jgi:hypothetical protein